MLNNINFKYNFKNSSIHNLSPLIKIICLIIFLISSFLTYDLKVNIVLTVLLLLLVLSTKISLKQFLYPISNLKWLIVFILIINIIFKMDIYITIITILRLINLVLYSLILTFTTKSQDITEALRILLKPLKLIKIPVNEMAFSISLALQFIPNITNQANRIIKSQISRGIDHKNLKNKISSISSLIIPIFRLSIKKADQIADIMEIRCYNINNYKIELKKIDYYDIFILIVHIAILLLAVKEFL